MSARDADYSDVSEFLFQLETELELWRWVIDGVPVWDYVRAPLQRTLFGEINSAEGTSSDEEGIHTYLKGTYLWGRNLLFKNPLFGDCDVLSYGTGRRKKMPDGDWWDIYFDPVYNQTNLDYLHIDQHFKNAHKTPAKTEQLTYNDFIHYSGTICNKLGLFDPDFSNHDAEMIAEIERHVEETFDVSVALTSLIRRKIREARARKPLYDLLLDRVDPEIALLTCSYGRESFVAACKDNGVPVVELQHGAIDPYHPGYSFPGNSTKSTFPDYLFVWGDFWKENIEFPISDENVMVTGYPYLEQEAKRYEDVETCNQIVVISQPTVGTKLSKFAVELAEDDRISADIVYKLHPKEYEDWKNHYPWLLQADLSVIAGNDPPLYYLLAQSRILVGAFSTVIYEGFYFGLETFLVESPSSLTMEWISDFGGVHLIRSVDEFVEQYRETGQTPETNVFFETDSINYVEEMINSILE